MLTLEERGCGEASSAEPRCADRAVALGKQAGNRVRTFNQVVTDLPAKLRSDCDVKADDVGWPTKWIRCFDEADTKQSEWLTQGIGGTGEWRTDESPGGGQHYLVATWCWRGSEGIDEADICNPEEAVKRTRISLISVERNGYRNMELVEPSGRAGHPPPRRRRGDRRSMALCGRHRLAVRLQPRPLRRGLRRPRPASRSGTGTSLPAPPIATGTTRSRRSPSTDRATSPRLVAAEYRLNPGGRRPRHRLAPRGRRPAAARRPSAVAPGLHH